MKYDHEHFTGDKSYERDNDALAQENERLKAELAEHKKRTEGLEGLFSRSGPISPYYSAALDEIWHLRKALAYEESILRGYLDFSTLPKSIATSIGHQRARMSYAIKRGAQRAYRLIPNEAMMNIVHLSAMPNTLTRWSWEEEVERRALNASPSNKE